MGVGALAPLQIEQWVDTAIAVAAVGAAPTDLLSALDTHISTRAYFAGYDLSLADIALVSGVHARAGVYGLRAWGCVPGAGASGAALAGMVQAAPPLPPCEAACDDPLLPLLSLPPTPPGYDLERPGGGAHLCHAPPPQPVVWPVHRGAGPGRTCWRWRWSRGGWQGRQGGHRCTWSPQGRCCPARWRCDEVGGGGEGGMGSGA